MRRNVCTAVGGESRSSRSKFIVEIKGQHFDHLWYVCLTLVYGGSSKALHDAILENATAP